MAYFKRILIEGTSTLPIVDLTSSYDILGIVCIYSRSIIIPNNGCQRWIGLAPSMIILIEIFLLDVCAATCAVLSSFKCSVIFIVPNLGRDTL